MTDIEQIEREAPKYKEPIELMSEEISTTGNGLGDEFLLGQEGPVRGYKIVESAADEIRKLRRALSDETARAVALTAERDALRAALISVLDVISEESGWGTWRRMEGSEIYNDANKARETARAALEKGTDT